nr:hypothetical protein [Tanacetum cinerariifolium]
MKLLSAPVSNKIEAQRLFKRNVPVTTLASGFPPAEIILEMTLSSTLKASGNSLICRCGPPVVVVVVVIVVGVSSLASIISGYMASLLAVGAFGTTWSIMVEVAFKAQRFGSSIWFLFSRPCSIGPCNIVVPFEWLLVLLVP